MRPLFARTIFVGCLFFSVAALAADAQPRPPALRLPDGVRPRHYAVDLTIVPTSDSFTATATLELDVTRSASIVWLDGDGLDVKKARFTVAGKSSDARVVPGGADFIGFVPTHALPVGPATLTIEYRGEISSKSSNGLFRQQEGGDWYVFTHFAPDDARRVFPSFDEPSYKVPWQLRLTVRKSDVALSNTPEVSSRDLDGGMKQVTFAETKPLPSYLMAIGVGPFDFADGGRAGEKNVPVRIVVPHGRAAEARWAREVTAKIVNELERYFGRPYAYEKIDIISVPLIGGAMENPGLITFAQSIVLARPEEESLRFKRGYASIAMHELAHQWFGDLVTTAWWDDIWLNEAFATWMTDQLLPRLWPSWHIEEAAAMAADGVMYNDSLVSARRIRQPIASKDDIHNAFDGITYEKGAAVIAMFERWVGRDRFQQGIRAYLDKYAHGAATADQFLAAIAAHADPGKRVPEAFATFLNQPGVPLVGVALSCAGAPKLSLTQQRYVRVGQSGVTPERWEIPVCARYPTANGLTRACTLMTEATAELPLAGATSCPAWVDANPDGGGYYRVQYHGDLLQRLLADGGKRLAPAEKVRLLGDIEAVVYAGQLDWADAIRLEAPFATDASRTVVTQTISLVGGLRDSEYLPPALLPNYARFIRKTWGPRAHALGLKTRPGDDDDTRFLRPTLVSLVADQGEDPDLRRQALVEARAWLSDPKAVDPDMAATVLSIAARAGDATLYDAYLAAAKRESNRTRRNWLLRALGQFPQPELAQRSLGLVLSGEFDFRESSTLMWAPLSLPSTRTLAWDFIKTQFDAIVAKAPRDYGAALTRAAGSFCDEPHRAEAAEFFAPRAPLYAGGPRNLSQSLERAHLCAALREKESPSLTAFFAKQ